MDLYDSISYDHAKRLTIKYSTSFSLSSRLFSRSIRPHIYAIYGMVRLADEIVDTYDGPDKAEQLAKFRASVDDAVKSGYSPHPIVHAFCLTARAYHIDDTLIAPFMDSMTQDLTPTTYTEKIYRDYIYGSADVVGLMCLKVFVEGDDARYEALRESAAHLGSAYQKVNFLRDIAADHAIGRWYFPGCTFETFSEDDKQAILSDIRHDFAIARSGLHDLPRNCRAAVNLSAALYMELTDRLERTSADDLKQARTSVPTLTKLTEFIIFSLRKGFGW